MAKITKQELKKLISESVKKTLIESMTPPAHPQTQQTQQPVQQNKAQAQPQQPVSAKPSRNDIAVMDDIYKKLAQLVESPTIKANSKIHGILMQSAQAIRNCTF